MWGRGGSHPCGGPLVRGPGLDLFNYIINDKQKYDIGSFLPGLLRCYFQVMATLQEAGQNAFAKEALWSERTASWQPRVPLSM